MSYPRRPAPHSVSGSALVLTLLITALLATIVVSFLSTSRVEMMAARNFSRQNAASGLAELATQQAMAKIQLGFNTTANMTGNYSSVVTTQPGAIHKYFFQNGTMTWNSTVEQFSAGNMSINGTVTPLSASISNETVNLNNLSNPRGNATGNLTLTGNAFEQINVQMEEVQDSSGNLVGRVAYYVDDEGTKLNVNNATGNRTTLNAGSVRSLSFSALSSNYAANFTAVVDGSAGNGTSTVKNWAHFFRPEQVGASLGNSSAAPDEITTKLPFISTATTSCNNTANMTHLLTPWGTQRIAINTLSTNATDGNGTASVSSIFEALTGLNATSVNGTYTASNSTYGITGRGLQNIFGGNFSTKYTPAGVKQIAANMLQMRSPNTFSVNASFGYNGSTLCDALGPDPDPYNTTQNYFGIPSNYLANTPFPVINEIGATIGYEHVATSNGTSSIGTPAQRELVVLFIYLELFNPYHDNYVNSTDAAIVFMLDKIQFKTNSTGNTTVGVSNDFRGYIAGLPNHARYYAAYGNQNAADPGIRFSAFRSEPVIKIPDIPARSTRTIRLECFTFWYNTMYPGIGVASTRIIGDLTIGIERILLLANYNSPLSIRDAISGNDIGNIVIPATDVKRMSWNVGSPFSNALVPGNGSITFKRLDARNKTTRNGTATEAFVLDGNTSITRNGSSYQDNIAPTPDSTSGYDIPGDPILSNNSTFLLSSNSTADKLPPVLDFPAFSSPADLGKVPTNTLYRSLRMQMQPIDEVSLTPDWAMLDVISLGNSTDSNNAFNRMLPVNINGRFHLPGNVTLAPRTIGIQALAQVLENSSADKIQDPMNPATSNSTDTTRFRGNTVNATTIVNNIGNMAWSTSSAWANRRTNKNFPTDQYILPSEIMEIAGVTNEVDQTNYTNSSSHFKWNEGRASALIPAVTTRSSFFTIYAYAQAGRENPTTNQFEVDSEALTKTLVEVEITTPATASAPAEYKVKKLYSQNLPMGD
jgi:hypothetical protein